MENKQSCIEWLINCITEDQMVKSKSLYEWLEIFEQAKAMHKEEIVEAVYDSMGTNFDPSIGRAELYYKEKYENGGYK